MGEREAQGGINGQDEEKVREKLSGEMPEKGWLSYYRVERTTFVNRAGMAHHLPSLWAEGTNVARTTYLGVFSIAQTRDPEADENDVLEDDKVGDGDNAPEILASLNHFLVRRYPFW